MNQTEMTGYLFLDGWRITPYRLVRTIGRFEFSIEFCIGDFCVAVYNERLDLIDGKYREFTPEGAINRAYHLIDKYKYETQTIPTAAVP